MVDKMDKMKFQTLGDDRKINMMFDKMQEMIEMLDYLDRNQVELFNKDRMHRR